jgi:hypothetical protein
MAVRALCEERNCLSAAARTELSKRNGKSALTACSLPGCTMIGPVIEVAVALFGRQLG